MVHTSIIFIAFLLVQKGTPSLSTIVPFKDAVYVSSFIDSPAMEEMKVEIKDKGKMKGGGGGGENEQAPAASGRLPDAAPYQLILPEPGEPQPLLPDDAVIASASIVMPIEIHWDTDMCIGDITAPPSDSTSRGPGSDGGYGKGKNGGSGPGDGPGGGPGKGGGFNGGPYNGEPGGKNTIIEPGTLGLVNPEILFNPKPEYTEEARKQRIKGVVRIQAIVRKDGLIDDLRFIQRLGHGLDESAKRTIETEWRFRPGRLRGEPVNVPITIEVTFNMY